MSRIPLHAADTSNTIPYRRQVVDWPACLELIETLISSPSPVVAGEAEVLKAALAAVLSLPKSAPLPPQIITVRYSQRAMAFGRQTLSTMDGRRILQYLRRGLQIRGENLSLKASFVDKPGELLEVDLDTWEELVPCMDTIYLE